MYVKKIPTFPLNARLALPSSIILLNFKKIDVYLFHREMYAGNATRTEIRCRIIQRLAVGVGAGGHLLGSPHLAQVAR